MATRQLTNTPSITWDFSTPGQSKGNVVNGVTSTTVTSIVTITQAAYTALSTKNATTLYLIVG